MLQEKPVRRQAGSALMAAMVMILALAAILTSLFRLTTAEYMRSRRWRDETRSFYVAEAGMNEAYATLLIDGKTALLDLDYPRTFGSGTYSVEVTLGEDDPELLNNRIRLRVTGGEGREEGGIEVVAWAIPNGEYLFGCFGDDGVLLNSNVVIDSYDSKDGPYPGVAPAGFLANVGSNHDIELDANVQIYGDVVPGPSGALVDGDPGTYVSGATASADDLVVMDPVTVPVVSPSGALIVDGNLTLGPGAVHHTALTIKGGAKLEIVGPAVLVVDDFALLANADLQVDANLGPVEIYATGAFELRSNSTVTTIADRAKDISVFLTADTDGTPAPTVELNSNSAFTGTIYAPDADVKLASNFHVFGAVMAESLEFASNSALHFDEDLLYLDGVEPEYEQLSWRVLSDREE